MTRKRAQQRPMPVLAVVRNLDPRICGCCSYAHGTPGTRCARHGKYIDRLPTEEERTDADRQAEANKDPTVALPKILELLKLDTDDVDNLGEDPVARVRELVKMRDDIADIYEATEPDNSEIVASVRATYEERDAAFNAITDNLCEGVEEPSDKDDVVKVVEGYAADSGPKGAFVELLALVGMTEHEYDLTCARFPIMSASEFLLARVRAIIPEILGVPVTVVDPPKRRKRKE